MLRLALLEMWFFSPSAMDPQPMNTCRLVLRDFSVLSLAPCMCMILQGNTSIHQVIHSHSWQQFVEFQWHFYILHVS